MTLGYLDDMRHPPGSHTHELLIHEGSVLRVAPDEGYALLGGSASTGRIALRCSAAEDAAQGFH